MKKNTGWTNIQLYFVDKNKQVHHIFINIKYCLFYA